MQNRTIASISATCGILWIFILRNLITTFPGLWQFITSIFSGIYAALGDGIFAGNFLVISGIVAGAFVWQILSKRYEIVFTSIVGVIYLFALWYVLFQREPGSRGINLDLRQFGAQFSSTPLDMMWNIILFLPLGIVLELLLKAVWKTGVAGLIVLVMIEGAQYIFSVGVFDIIDILLNLLGVLLGALIVSSSVLDGWKFGRDRHFWTFTK